MIVSRRNRFTILYLFFALSSWAQNVRTVTGEYTYYAPESMSIEDAKRTALEQAKIIALGEEFGTIVNQSNTSVISNIDGESSVKFQSLSGSDVRGEWIENIVDPQFTVTHGEHFTSVYCKVKGKAREIKGAKIQYEFMPLRNGRDKRFKSVNFSDGDDLYLYFLTPVDGFLSVFLLDETAQTVYSILPYKRDRNPSFPVERNKEYILFSVDDAAPSIKNIVDEYQLSCDEEKEYNTLYILFSPEQIYRGKGYTSDDAEIPENIPFAEFRSRLGKLLAHNPQIQFSQISLAITR